MNLLLFNVSEYIINDGSSYSKKFAKYILNDMNFKDNLQPPRNN